jgi:hypothetical protein
LLPCTLYWACSIPLEQLLDDTSPPHLSQSDRSLYILTSSKLRGPEVSRALNFLWTPLLHVGCTDKVNCIAELAIRRKNAEVWRWTGRMPLDVWSIDYFRDFTVCPSCLKLLQDSYRKGLDAFWRRLPVIFSLPSWEILEKMKTESLGIDEFRWTVLLGN